MDLRPQRVLVVAAHPDDETLGSGGTIARYSELGCEVWVCLLSEGASSRHAYVDLQKDCARAACEVLGVAELIFCDLPDQRLDTLSLLDVITPIERCIARLQPDTVLTHFPEDANEDHRIVFRGTLVATRPVAGISVKRVMCFETPSSTEWAAPFPGSVFAPNVFVDVTSSLSTKLKAMSMYEHTHLSEVRPYPHPRSLEALDVYARRHGIAAGVEAAEPFMLVREVV
jgi:LmbE family N-acetylglucosaminyl deacetylase